jgi:hypothetical protein
VLVAALSLSVTDSVQRAQAWPPLLLLLERWADACAPAHRVPVRPWERVKPPPLPQQQHRPPPDGSNAPTDVLPAAMAIVLPVLAALSARAESGDGDSALELATLLPPVCGLFAAAAAVGEPARTAQLHSALGTACSALHCAAPQLLMLGTYANTSAAGSPGSEEPLSLLLRSWSKLASHQAQPAHVVWATAALLHALAAVVSPTLERLVGSAVRRQVCMPPSLEAWALGEAEQVAVGSVVSSLAGLYACGQVLGSALCRSMVAHASGQSRECAQQDTLQGLVELLQAAVMTDCSNGSGSGSCGSDLADETCYAVALSALAGTISAGLAAGLLQGVLMAGTAPGTAVATTTTTTPAWVAGEAAWTAAAPVLLGQQSPVLQPLWQQQVEQQVCKIQEVLKAACSCAEAATTAAAAAQAVVHLQPGGMRHASDITALTSSCATQLLGQAYARLGQSHGPALGQLPQGGSSSSSSSSELPALLCCLCYAQRQCCGLAGLHHAAGACGDAASAAAWLRTAAHRHTPSEVGGLGRWLAGRAAALPAPERGVLVTAAASGAAAAAHDCEGYLAATTPEVLAAIDGPAAQQQLDRLFALHLLLLDGAWRTAGQDGARPPQSDTPAAAVMLAELAQTERLAGTALACLSHLQFCALQLPAYGELLRSLVGSVAASATAADAFLTTALPRYDDLTSLLPLHSSAHASAVPRWVGSQVLLAQLRFLLPLLPLAVKQACCLQRAPEATGRVLPLLLLLVPHPDPSLSLAVHSALAGLFAVAAGGAGGAGDGLPLAHSASGAAHLLGELERAAPLYLLRALAALPGGGNADGLASVLHCLLRDLPASSAVPLLALQLVCQRAADLAGGGTGGRQTSGPSLPTDGSSCVIDADAARQLLGLLPPGLAVLPYQQLPAALQLLHKCVDAVPDAALPSWLLTLHDGVMAVEDCVRKPHLVAWLDSLAADVATRLQGLDRCGGVPPATGVL